MLMQKATPEMIEEWKAIWENYKDKLQPNRKSGSEIVDYIAGKYPLISLNNDEKAKQIVCQNVLQNIANFEKLPEGKAPFPAVFIVENKDNGKDLYDKQDEIFKGIDIFVGIDIVSGYFIVEGSSFLWDELFAFRGLDKKDIENFYLLAEYVACLEKFSFMEQMCF